MGQALFQCEIHLLPGVRRHALCSASSNCVCHCGRPSSVLGSSFVSISLVPAGLHQVFQLHTLESEVNSFPLLPTSSGLLVDLPLSHLPCTGLVWSYTQDPHRQLLLECAICAAIFYPPTPKISSSCWIGGQPSPFSTSSKLLLPDMNRAGCPWGFRVSSGKVREEHCGGRFLPTDSRLCSHFRSPLTELLSITFQTWSGGLVLLGGSTAE